MAGICQYNLLIKWGLMRQGSWSELIEIFKKTRKIDGFGTRALLAGQQL
jgi:hypothetical protein